MVMVCSAVDWNSGQGLGGRRHGITAHTGVRLGDSALADEPRQLDYGNNFSDDNAFMIVIM